MKNQKIIGAIVIVLVVAGLSFFGGMKYGQSKNSIPSIANLQGNFGQNGFNPNGGTKSGSTTGMMRGAANSGGFVSGQILSMDSKSMTIKLNDGGSKIVFFSPSTKVEKTVDGSVTDVTVGKQIMITGTTNSDGSVSANSIQIRPTLPAMSAKAN